MLAQPRPWYQQSVLYQIYPLSFADSNNDGFGDLRGIINHLDYLRDGTAESLGVGAIWLSPIYVSPMADWGYDVADYTAIDPKFGTMQDFEELVAAVHDRGMKLLLDYVPNHTSNQHPWFLEACSSRNSPKRDWYIWADAKPGQPYPNNWVSEMGGPAWEWHDNSSQYYLHTFLPEQPDLNWRNPQVRAAMLEVLRFWLRKGVDGFRADAVNGLFKDAKLRDDIPDPKYEPGISSPADQFLRVHSAGQPELVEALGSFCELLDEADGRYLLSEAYVSIPALHQLYLACNDHPVHAPFNFNLMNLEWSARAYCSFIDEYESMLGPDDWPNYVLGNHDRPRLVSRVGEERAKLLCILQLSLRGLPVIYNGEELGLPDIHPRPSQVRDPRGQRITELGLGRDGARGPMPWTGKLHGGFSRHQPWLPVGTAALHRNVERQERDPESSLSLYRHMIHLRTVCPALMEGDYRSMHLPDCPEVYAFFRETGLQRILVLLNFDDKPVTVTLRGEVGAWVAGTHRIHGDNEAVTGKIELERYEGRVYELRRGGGNASSL